MKKAFISSVVKMLLLCIALATCSNAFAYSYAAAGKEPLIDGREAILQALDAEDYQAVQDAVDGLEEEFAYLKSDHDVDLLTPMNNAIAQKDALQVESIIDSAVVEEIVRRLDGASKNLGDYQVAKVLVVKSKLFLDLILPKLDDVNRQQANESIVAVLESIGNPGVFGVGQTPADPERFEAERAKLMASVQGLKFH
ncbi:hypothetical protein [Vibrio sp. HN007]|uniref:hypothetical protein n=1 Tax=Vibrio iocasae TaxID=3098914 RepID=UPI0035D50F88